MILSREAFWKRILLTRGEHGLQPELKMPAFARYIGIDYSGAETPTASLKGLRVYLAEGDAPPVEVLPPPSPRKYWTRRGIAEWLVERLAEDVPTLVGIDHGFSFPLRYFEVHRLLPDWPRLPRRFPASLADGRRSHLCRFRARWRRREWRGTYGQSPLAAADRGTRGRREIGLSFRRAGLGGEIHPCRDSLAALHPPAARERVHFWPFDGWDIPAGRSAIAEVYPALWSRGFAREGRTGDQHDAFCIAAWLSRADRDGSLAAFLKPDLTPPERTLAQVEGWILGAA